MGDRAAETIGNIVADRMAEVLSEADGDDEALVRLCAAELRYSVAYQRKIEEIRDDAVLRLRERGVPMTRIAVLAKVSDSYLSRRLIGRGTARKVNRGKRL